MAQAPFGPGFVQPGEPGGFQQLAFRAGLAMLFVRLTALPEILATLLHFNTYLLYIVGPPAILGALVTGGLGRTFRHRAAKMWLGFVICILLSLPFSSWIGGSVTGFRLYFLYTFPLLFVVGGLTVTWSNVRATFLTFGVSGVFLIVIAHFMAKLDGEGRLTMNDSSGTIGNSNDLASLLILVLPFIMLIMLDKKRAAILRIPLIVPIAYALKMILGTASRGALVALAVAFVFVLWRASVKQKMAVLIAAGAMATAAPIFVNGNSLERLATLLGGDVEAHSVGAEALASQDERRYVLEQSIIATLKHPIFGVGIGQFPNYVGELGRAQGKVGDALHWTETHNAFTQISSECGIPALVFFVLGLGFAFGAVSKTYKKARREGYTEIANMSFGYLIAMLAYVVSIIFLANAYRLYLPAMVGLAVALSAAAEREMSAGIVKQSVGMGVWNRPFTAPRRMA